MIRTPPFRVDNSMKIVEKMIHAYLDISKIIQREANSTFEYLLYFNRANNFEYLNLMDEYPNFLHFEKNCIISDISIYTLPSINKINSLEDISITSLKVGLTRPPSTETMVITDL